MVYCNRGRLIRHTLTADQYIEEIRTLRNETEIACRRMLEEAQKKAGAIVGDAKQKDSAVDAILSEYRKRPRGRR